jgi:hypothetical protein
MQPNVQEKFEKEPDSLLSLLLLCRATPQGLMCVSCLVWSTCHAPTTSLNDYYSAVLRCCCAAFNFVTLQGYSPGLDACELPGLVDLSAGRYAGVMPQQALGLQLGLAYAQMYSIRCVTRLHCMHPDVFRQHKVCFSDV